MGHPTDKSRRMHFTVASLRDSAELLALTVVVAVFVLLSAARSSAAESAKEADASDAIPGSQLPASGDSGLVRATDRSPRPGTPLIANKLFPMGLTLEITPTIDYAYSEKWISHIGGHLSLGFHIFEWLGVEAFAGGFYPRELAITTTVREKGHTVATCAVGLDCDPKLSGLWQSFAFGGAVVEWAPLYGKLSIVSEFDLSFQLYFVGGAAIEATARPVTVLGSTVNNTYDFFPGVISGQQYSYNPRISAAYGAGLRLIPWKWVAIRLELRNLTGLNPPVPGYEDEQPFDISNLPLITFGISLLI